MHSTRNRELKINTTTSWGESLAEVCDVLMSQIACLCISVGRLLLLTGDDFP